MTQLLDSTVTFKKFLSYMGGDSSYDSSSYESESFYRRALEKSHKKGKKCGGGCGRRERECGECSLLSESNYGPEAAAEMLPVGRHDKHWRCIRNFEYLLSSDSGRKAFKEFKHHADCYPNNCPKDCCISWGSSSSSSCSSSSSSGCPTISSEASLQSVMSDDELILLFQKFMMFWQSTGAAASSAKPVQQIRKEVSVDVAIKENGIIEISGKSKGKKVTSIKPTIKVHVGDNLCFLVKQYSAGAHQFFITDSSVGGPQAKPLMGSPLPISSGKMCYHITADTPKQFYYGLQDMQNMGGMIEVVA